MGNSLGVRLERKIVPKELRKIVPKELTAPYHDQWLGKTLGTVPGPIPEIPAPPPPESIDEDAFRLRDRARRRARRSSTVRTSATGAPYSPAPKSLLGG